MNVVVEMPKNVAVMQDNRVQRAPDKLIWLRNL
jgi:hypothetical protein